jgi:hypothetical protein
MTDADIWSFLFLVPRVIVPYLLPPPPPRVGPTSNTSMPSEKMHQARCRARDEAQVLSPCLVTVGVNDSGDLRVRSTEDSRLALPEDEWVSTM